VPRDHERAVRGIPAADQHVARVEAQRPAGERQELQARGSSFANVDQLPARVRVLPLPAQRSRPGFLRVGGRRSPPSAAGRVPIRIRQPPRSGKAAAHDARGQMDGGWYPPSTEGPERSVTTTRDEALHGHPVRTRHLFRFAVRRRHRGDGVRHREAGPRPRAQSQPDRSKRWLADTLAAAAGGRFGTVTVLGGWFGVLARDPARRPAALDRARGERQTYDPRGCAEIARSINATHSVRTGRFAAGRPTCTGSPIRPPRRAGADPDLIVKHVVRAPRDFGGWFAGAGRTARALQSNDYYAIVEHVKLRAGSRCIPRPGPARRAPLRRRTARKRYRRSC